SPSSSCCPPPDGPRWRCPRGTRRGTRSSVGVPGALAIRAVGAVVVADEDEHLILGRDPPAQRAGVALPVAQTGGTVTHGIVAVARYAFVGTGEAGDLAARDAGDRRLARWVARPAGHETTELWRR